MTAIFVREFKAYFQSIIGFLFVAVLTFFIGLYSFLINAVSGYPYIGIIFSNVIFIFMFAFPILTMRSMAEERKTKSDQLLITSPVSLVGIVLGKFFAMAAVYGIPCLFSATLVLLNMLRTNHYTIPDLLAILVFFLMGCVYIAIGMFISALTESQVIAAIVSILAFVSVYLTPTVASFIPESAVASLVTFIILVLVLCIIYFILSNNFYVTVFSGVVGIAAIVAVFFIKKDLYTGLANKLFATIDMLDPMTQLSQYSVFNLTGVVYYVSLSAFFCFLTVMVLQKRRWN